jgi:hypothetical protein
LDQVDCNRIGEESEKTTTGFFTDFFNRKPNRSLHCKSALLTVLAAVDARYRCEIIMTQANHPSKYEIRKYLERRTQEKTPPPSPEEIRRQLGWGLLMLDPYLAPALAGR